MAFVEPSTNTLHHWLLQEAPEKLFESSDSSGKWCIFRSPDTVDEAWRVVARLVIAEKLVAAKVSTMKSLVIGGYDLHVICVYTQNWRDEQEVQRVREVLRAAGFNERLQYKRDADTAAGIERFVYES